ncbi:LLM class flavin-dependent oxidoreductase [Rhodococcus sp. IEGM 1305]|uniref:LLM class flavin-dependent oxidoreductase n=1 Tax=Rhodococcus sp. IEGM 1305 TaxID=3047092 RepID=UPI0024B70367|nr:LLM class flavin-dependent oxidoreductase [Rhodococcus sp. IEGM 1305]MDI9949308.1 LLM class flavin-dependent oxidoreductase [Rhodococcus sp. IEGM 1305]
MAIEQDLRHVEDLDRLGFHQVWFGEHHSGGYEVGPSPELMIAAAAQRTSRIELCSVRRVSSCAVASYRFLTTIP